MTDERDVIEEAAPAQPGSRGRHATLFGLPFLSKPSRSTDDALVVRHDCRL